MRTSKKFSVKNPELFKEQLLHWANSFEETVWLDSNTEEKRNYDAILAVQAFTAIKTDAKNAFNKLREYQEITKDWVFGYLSYDLKNDVENLKSNNKDALQFPELYFFQPQKLILLKNASVEFKYLGMVDEEIETDFIEIGQFKTSLKLGQYRSPLSIKPDISKEEYLQKIAQMQVHIQQGDIYEANFCMEFYSEDQKIMPLKIFKHLNEISRPPFAAFMKLEEFYLLCASPERYIKKEGSKITSQPIKGTAKRDKDRVKDAKIAHTLCNNSKERSENVMIVDLVRNDLSKIAKKGSVKVEELCALYSFEQVHQLVSTISAVVEENIPAVEVLRASFPMGSMTGAPKISAMQIIEQLEESKRGLYSGALGYFSPTGDFDFNVVIRSILYNEKKEYVSFSVGSAITSQSQPEKEYEECLLKAKALRQVLEN